MGIDVTSMPTLTVFNNVWVNFKRFIRRYAQDTTMHASPVECRNIVIGRGMPRPYIITEKYP